MKDPSPARLIQHFKDDATAFNAKKHEVIEGKGVLNNRISEYVFQHLNEIGVPTHFIRRLNMREQLIREVEIIPLEVVVRNVAAGSLSTRLGIEEGTQLPRSIIEFYYKNDQLGDPMVSEEHITAFGWATPQEIDDIMALAIRVNDFLSGPLPRRRHPSRRFQDGDRAAVGKRHDADRGGGRDLARIRAGCGTSRPTTSSTRTVSAAISAGCSRPIPRSPSASASWRRASARRAPGRCW